jgi:uncharacterized protein YoxC
MPVSGSVGALLLQAASDSTGARHAAAGGGLLETLAIVAFVIVALLLIALLVLLIPAVRSLRRTSEKVEALLGRLSGDLDPIVRHATNIADNADYISTAVRADVGQVSLTVRRANDRLNEALGASERRVRELGALLRVFQDEVEHTFVSGTSVVRGIRAGADALRDGTDDFLDRLDDFDDEPDDFVDEPGEFMEGGTILDSDDEFDDDIVDDIDDEIEDTLEEGEERDTGYDWARDGRDRGDGPEEKPRIRRRPAR